MKLKPMSSRKIVRSAVAGIALLAIVRTGEAGETENALAAWRNREAQVDSLRVEWVTTYADRFVKDPSTFKMSDQRKLSTREHLVLIRGKKVLYRESRGTGYKTWALDLDGATNQSLLDPGGVYTDYRYPQASIRRWSRGDVRKNAYFFVPTPPLALYRMLSLSDFDRASFKETVREEKFNDRRAVVLTENLIPQNPPNPFGPSGDSVVEYWLDPALNYALVRYAWSSPNGKVLKETNVNYEEYANNKWRLTGWTTLSGISGRMTSAEVRRLEVNPPLSQSDVKIDIPVGSVVSDETADVTYLLRAGGEQTVIDTSQAFSYAKTLRHDG